MKLTNSQSGYDKTVTSILFAITLLCSSVTAAPNTSSSSSNKTDPCAAIAGQSTATFHEAKACLDHFPYNETIASQTLDTVRKVTKELYVFNEIATSPPKIEGLSAVPVDISHGLDIIQHDKWHSDREFQEAVALLLDKVHDTHLVYSPFCYRQFIFWQPIQLNALVRDQKSVVNVAYVKNDIWPEAKESWVGCEVTEIDGKNSMDMIVNYAVNNNGESKDVNTCFNNIMNTKTYFHGWDDGADDLGYHRFLPAQEMHSYTMRCPKKGTKPSEDEFDEPFTVKVPWVAQVPINFNDATTYWENYCQSSHTNYAKRDAVGHLDVEELRLMHEGQAFDLSPEAARNAAAGGKRGPYVEFIALDKPQADVGVIDIQSFSIESSDRQEFIDTFYSGLKEFESKGIKKIVLDLSSNGGGDACAGEFIINTFFGSTPDYPSDIKYSPFLERVIKKATEVPGTKWGDYKNEKYSGAEWFTKTNTYTRGKEQVKFSQPVSLSCDRWESELTIDKKIKTPWKAEDLLILSDGRCGSTCAIVASRLRISHQVAAMGLGGIRGNRMQFASFPGGESERLSGFLMDLQQLDLQDDPDAPSPFPERADMGWTFREAYRPTATGKEMGKETELLEYSVNNADCRMHFDDENSNDVKKLWSDVAQVFTSGQCPLIKD
ncbi:hypothetical protein BCR42DRAFT_479887 [Absidia repens]|uniref:Tail specific protease domain-containing protein n=1 Tax=Absidia repens TaxID=90262 RepID=A0A1X2J3N0_9FUNG|nr:hypothetical protein BCR42DRAFT_479887 [Absidia repens]